MVLTTFEREKYDRHLRVEGFTEQMQLRLLGASVLVIGAGGLGCPVLQYLTSAGIGHIGIVDPDVVSVSNLQRQILYGPSDVGMHKAQLAADRIRLLNPNLKVEVYCNWLTDELADNIFNRYQVVVGATDNFKSRYLIDQKSKVYKIPFVHGAIREFEGQVGVFNYQGSISYTEMFGEYTAETSSTTGVIGAIPGIIGSMMALEVLKILSQKAEVMSNKLLLFDGASNQIRVLKH